MKQFGIDLSKWQGNFNFDSALEEGVSFAILKGGGGDDGLYKDSKFEHNYTAAKALNIPVGTYWFSHALTVEEAKQEAEYFYKNILSGKQFELPVFIDVEHENMLKLGKDILTDIIESWCIYLENMGYWVGIYSSVYNFSAHMNDSKLVRFTHWVAQWAKECTYPNKEILGIWQFGGDTNLIRNNMIAGVVCDQNYMYQNFPEHIKTLGLNGFKNGITQEVPTVTPVKTTEELANEVIAGKWGVGNDRKNRLTEAGYGYDDVQSLVDKLLSPKIPAQNNTVKAGDLVRISVDAVIYGTEKKFAGFVYNTLLYVRELKGDRAVISTQPEGAITGAVDIKYLTKHRT